MIKTAGQVAKSVRAKSIFIYVDALEQQEYTGDSLKGNSFIAVTKKFTQNDEEFIERFPRHLILPKIKLGRIGLIKISIAYAISAQMVGNGDRVVFLCGTSDLMTLDTLTVFEIGKESEIITTKNITGIADAVQPQVFESTLNLALELAVKGREGKPVGTIFVIGDEDKVMQLSKQMIINPFKGYEEDERNILNPSLEETMREFSALDGAFVIGSNGTVLTAGRYLGASAESANTARGLGSRHMAAAGITALTQSVAIVVSESTGDVRIYKNGSTLLEIEKP